jgi:hypothetical protein
VTDSRGQLVLLAAATVAVAFAAILLAYLQLGYHPDVQASSDFDASVENGKRFLQLSAHDATVNVAGHYDWSERTRAVSAVRTRLDGDVKRLETARVERGIVYRVRYNHTAAETWRRAYCPSGPDRQFGACRADRGVIVQNRSGRTHVIGVAMDLVVTTPDGESEVTLRLHPTKS